MNQLAQFIRENKAALLQEWLAEAALLPSAQALSAHAIRDHIPEILDKLADAIDRDDTTALPLTGVPNLHAALRVREGYDLRQVVAEYRKLRTVILESYRRSDHISAEPRPRLQPLTVMNAALDAAIADAVDQYALDQGTAREMFIGMLGHDLRQPLNTIVFSAGMLADHPELTNAKVIERIATSAARMNAMIGDLLDFARARLGGGLPVVPVALDARALIAGSVDEIAHAHPDRRIDCLVTQAEGDFSVQWDGDRISQALSNLVGNAIAHGQDPVLIEPKDEESRITIEVRNRGEIPPERLPHIFAPFSPPAGDRRIASASTGPERRRGHLGLGLYIVREIAAAHGGTVRASSAGGWTTFALSLPRHAKSVDPRSDG